jgi:hypothetical protein
MPPAEAFVKNVLSCDIVASDCAIAKDTGIVKQHATANICIRSNFMGILLWNVVRAANGSAVQQ